MSPATPPTRAVRSPHSRGTVVACALALLTAFGGAALAFWTRSLQPRRQVEHSGLRLRLERATWLHEPVDHGDAVKLPASTGAPRPGEHRLRVELTLFNAGQQEQGFSPRELLLTSSSGPAWRPSGGEPEASHLLPAQALSLSLHFDVPSTAGPLRLEWERSGERAALLSTRPPPSVSEPAAPVPWPPRVEELPPGNPVAGSALFRGRFACIACHGDPAQQGPRRLGPSLRDFARVGARRVVGRTAAQYAYESLLDPGAYVAPECGGGAACPQPSTMPLYGELLSPQQMADMVSYLVSLGAEE